MSFGQGLPIGIDQEVSCSIQQRLIGTEEITVICMKSQDQLDRNAPKWNKTTDAPRLPKTNVKSSFPKPSELKASQGIPRERRQSVGQKVAAKPRLAANLQGKQALTA